MLSKHGVAEITMVSGTVASVTLFKGLAAGVPSYQQGDRAASARAAGALAAQDNQQRPSPDRASLALAAAAMRLQGSGSPLIQGS